MDKKLMVTLMERAMPAFPNDANAAERRFSAVQLQACAFAAMEALLAQLPDVELTDDALALIVKDTLRDLAHVENHLERTGAPSTVRNRTIDIRCGIRELSVALVRAAATAS